MREIDDEEKEEKKNPYYDKSKSKYIRSLKEELPEVADEEIMKMMDELIVPDKNINWIKEYKISKV